VYGLTSNFIVALLAFFAFTTARGLTGPVYGTWSNQHIPSDVRATVLSMQSQTDAIGQTVGGPPLGALGERRLPLAFLASALILSPALWLLRRAGRYEPVAELAAAEA
jgi:DHA3 family tetracycline resistance protein-like MFS transporter